MPIQPPGKSGFAAICTISSLAPGIAFQILSPFILNPIFSKMTSRIWRTTTLNTSRNTKQRASHQLHWSLGIDSSRRDRYSVSFIPLPPPKRRIHPTLQFNLVISSTNYPTSHPFPAQNTPSLQKKKIEQLKRELDQDTFLDRDAWCKHASGFPPNYLAS